MTVRLDAEQLSRVLLRTPSEQNILIVGDHGIGKSELVRDQFESAGFVVVPLFLGQMADPGDLIGLPYREDRQTRFAAPHWWPDESTPIVLFLDELNRARSEILQAVMDLTLNRTLAGRALPSGSRLVAAVNGGDRYSVTRLDPAMVSRFNVYEFSPSTRDWLRWARRKHLHPRLIEFIESSPHWLDDASNTQTPDWMQTDPLEPRPDRRAWARVGEMLKDVTTFGEHDENFVRDDSVDEPSGNDDPLFAMIGGAVGGEAAAAFERFIRSQTSTSIDTLDDDAIESIGDRPLVELTRLNEQFVNRLGKTSDTDPNVDPSVVDKFVRYVNRLDDAEHGEAMAHLVSQLMRNDPAMRAIESHPDVLMRIGQHADVQS